MSIKLTNQSLNNLEPTGKPYFVRDSILQGLGVKVTAKGQLKYVVEVWHEGSSTRKTIGEFPYMPLQEARKEALQLITEIKTGLYKKEAQEVVALKDLLKEYLKSGRLKPRTTIDYQVTVNCYLRSWLNTPVNEITKKMVEKKFCQIRDKGVNGGGPTLSMAAKTMRVLSALLNYARGDDLIEHNPVEILKLKKIKRTLSPKTSYLRPPEVLKLLEVTKESNHPGDLAVLLMLYTGLRKREAVSIQWSDIRKIEGLSVIVIGDTKNHQQHYVPVTPRIAQVLNSATNSSQHVFPSPQNNDAHMSYLNKTVSRLSKAIGKDFTPHDLRRTFATRASEVGIDYLMIKRLMNHKTNDITARYIQWDSRKNLEAMREALDMIVW